MSYTFEELQNRINRIDKARGYHGATPDGWFFPTDVAPHDASFKYACQKFHKIGLLERQGDSTDHYGYQYRIRKPQAPTDGSEANSGDGI